MTSIVSQPKHAPSISMIVAALAPSMGIGHQGRLPWRLRQEIKYFKNVTTATPSADHVNAVIMGRKTWESIPAKFRPLPARLNIVLSRSYTNTTVDGVWFYNSIAACLRDLASANYQVDSKQLNRIFVIGGAQLYNQLIHDPAVSHLLITHVEYTGSQSPPAIDTWLDWDLSQWQEAPRDDLARFNYDEAAHAPNDEYIHEGDYKYKYTLWNRKTS